MKHICIFRWTLFWVIFLTLGVMIAISPSTVAVASRVRYEQDDKPLNYRQLGNYYALIIGIDAYEHWAPLKTSVNDAMALRKVLIERYGFPPENVILRRDGKATQKQITDDLLGILPHLDESDNLLVYFSGHGELRKDAKEGYWIPVDGEIDSLLTWISHSSVKNWMASSEVKAKNIVVIADSCYGGFLTRAGESHISRSLSDQQNKLLRLAAKPSRQVIASGSMEPVADWGKDGHSLFAYYFLQALKTNTEPLIDIKTLIYSKVWPYVTETGDIRPTMGRFDFPMDKDGEFVLSLGAESVEATPQAPDIVSRKPDERSEPPRLSEARMSIMVLPFQGHVQSAPDLEEMITNHLFDTRRFNVKGGGGISLDYDFLQHRASDLASIGKILDVDAVVTGEVLVNSSGIEVKVWVIDSDNAEMLTREDAFSEATDRVAVRNLCKALALKIAVNLPLLEGIVVMVEGNEIYVDIGVESDLKPNMELIVYKLSKPIIHPKTKKVLKEGTARVIAKAKVMSVEEGLSTACIVERISDAAIEPEYRVITR